MCVPVLSLTFTKSSAHTLRTIAVLTFIPGFLMLAIQGLKTHQKFPAVGIVPLFFSTAFSALLLAKQKRCGCQPSGLIGALIFVCEVILGAGLLVVLIWWWVVVPWKWVRREMIMLGSYGTNFLIVNL